MSLRGFGEGVTNKVAESFNFDLNDPYTQEILNFEINREDYIFLTYNS